MHLALAQRADNLGSRVESLRNALAFAPKDGQLRDQILAGLATDLRQQADANDPTLPSTRRLLAEAAEYFEAATRYEEAGQCHLSLEQVDRAAAAYAKAGLVDKVEELLAQQDRRRTRARALDNAFSQYEMLLQGGERWSARDALSRCIEFALRKGEYRRLLADLDKRLLSRGRVNIQVGSDTLSVLGRLPISIGRDGECDLVVRGPSVSRIHISLDYDLDTHTFIIEDRGSRNGTCVAGLPIAGELPLPDQATIDLGESCRLVTETHQSTTPHLELRVERGMDAGKSAYLLAGETPLRLLHDDTPEAQLSFPGGRPTLCSVQGLLLNNARVDRAELMEGDVIRQGTWRIEVLQ
jgi:pSer/pThr/pTyr-binding forkhead associated (FHA) protein